MDLVSRTINSLSLINQEIEDNVAEIESYTRELEDTRVSLEKQRKNNTALIANFSKLLETEQGSCDAYSNFIKPYFGLGKIASYSESK